MTSLLPPSRPLLDLFALPHQVGSGTTGGILTWRREVWVDSACCWQDTVCWATSGFTRIWVSEKIIRWLPEGVEWFLMWFFSFAFFFYYAEQHRWRKHHWGQTIKLFPVPLLYMKTASVSGCSQQCDLAFFIQIVIYEAVLLLTNLYLEESILNSKNSENMNRLMIIIKLFIVTYNVCFVWFVFKPLKGHLCICWFWCRANIRAEVFFLLRKAP